MKTAEEWDQLDINSTIEFQELIKQIQLDAYKAGMTEAAQLVFMPSLSKGQTEDSIKRAILTARDNKTSL